MLANRHLLHEIPLSLNVVPEDPVTQTAAAFDDPEQRVRVILDVPRGLLPAVELPWLRRYYQYLAGRLALPFAAQYVGQGARLEVTVVRVTDLIAPEPGPNVEEIGLLCVAADGVARRELPLVDIEVETDHPSGPLLEDYWYWFWNWRFDPRI